MAKAKKKGGRPRKGKKHKVMRVTEETHSTLLEMKGEQTFDEMFDEVFESRKLIAEAPKVYEVAGKILRGFSLAEARKVAKALSNEPLKILLELGEDE